jgi:hypothetical protein
MEAIDLKPKFKEKWSLICSNQRNKKIKNASFIRTKKNVGGPAGCGPAAGNFA